MKTKPAKAIRVGDWWKGRSRWQVGIEDEVLFDKFIRFYIKQLPLKLADVGTSIDEAFDKNHMLHYMYHLIVRNKRANNNNEDSQDNRAPNIDPEPTELAQEGVSLGGEIPEPAMDEDEQSSLNLTDNNYVDDQDNRDARVDPEPVELARMGVSSSGQILKQAMDEDEQSFLKLTNNNYVDD
ncbi:hypothetical protein ACH5RR_003115 [Cinchona calisaya]|uniref:Uncharacterized protein n=1 Tax=Cinchona calisaya TaxID=153742 RepID=A0ABD3AU17_9GENT